MCWRFFMDANKINTGKISQNVVLHSRERLSINGIKDIISFDESNVNLKTVDGDLCIDGEGIHIDILNIDKGEIEMRGRINGINFYDSLDSTKTSLLSRIFK